jgi:predicted nucleic-acid-binding Zn-ribbon protein
MNNCNHAAFQRQFELEHFTFIVARCQRCGEFLQSKAFIKEAKKEVKTNETV